MPTALRTTLFAAALALAAAAPARADTPGPDWMTVEQAKAKLAATGYTSVTKIEADDGHYEGEGVKAGALREFHLDPRTGALTKDQPKR